MMSAMAYSGHSRPVVPACRHQARHCGAMEVESFGIGRRVMAQRLIFPD